MKLSLVFLRILLVLLVLSYSISIQGQHLTISTSGQTTSPGTNWSISGNTLTVASGSANIHPSVITNHLTNIGSLTINLPWQSGVTRDIYINNSIAYTGNNARSLIFNAANDIIVASGVGITSSNASMNLVLRSAIVSGAPDHGRIQLDGTTITTNGGHFWAGGGFGNTTWNSLTVGNNYSMTWADDVSGISFIGSTLTSGGGNIYMAGLSFNTSDGDGQNYGISIRNSTLSSAAGQIDILGDLKGRYLMGSGLGIFGNEGAVNISSTTGAINLTGSGADQSGTNTGWRRGILLYTSNAGITVTSTSGNITISGTAAFPINGNDDMMGLQLGTTPSIADGVKITSRTGNILLTGSNTRENAGQSSNALQFIAANIANSIRIGFDGTNAYSGNITIEGNSIFQSNVNAGSGSISVQSTGALTIRPSGTAFTYLRAGASGSLTFDDDWNFGSSLSGFTFGKSTNTLDLSYASPLTVAGPITFHSGNFTLNENITSTTASDITINARQNFNTSGTVRRTISSAGGNITINADADANGSGQVNLDYLTLSPGAGNTIIRGETFDWIIANNTDKPYINGTGSFTLESSDASFGQLVQTHWFLFDQDANGIGGLTLGKATNTSNVLVDAAHSIAGPIQIYGGDITIDQNLNTTAGGVNGDVLVKSTANIVFEGSRSITTSGGDVILWANSDGAATEGGVFFKLSSSVTTGGGHIWIAGGSGSTTWNGLTVGDGFAVSGRNPSDLGYVGGFNDWSAGVVLIQATLSSAGGNIYIAGQRNSSSITLGAGFINNSGTGTLIDAGAGTITIKGSNTAGGNGAFGVMTGLHPNGYTGRFVVRSSNNSAANAIVIEGTTSGSNGDGILVENHARFLSTATTNGGGISITGVSPRNALSVGIGANAGTLDVLSASGAININVGIYPLLVASQGNMKLGSIVNDADVGSSTANVVITSNNVSWTGSVPIRTSGTLIVTPTTGSSFAATLNSSALNFSGISGLVLGNATNTAGITIGASTSIAGPITLYGGTLTFNENLSSTNGGAISLYGSALSFATNKMVSSTGPLLVAPLTANNTIGVAGASGTFQVTATHLSTNFANGFSNITIGSDNQVGNITTNTFTLQDPVTFKTSGSLTLGARITLGANDVTIGGSVSSVTGNATNYFQTSGVGSVKKSITNTGAGRSFLFPVGNSTYNPITITNNTSGTDDFAVRVVDEVYQNGNSGPLVLTANRVKRTWDISKATPSANSGSGVNMLFTWTNDAAQVNGTVTVPKLHHFEGGSWVNKSFTDNTTFSSGQLTFTGYKGDFSPFAIMDDQTPLPVTWLSFTGMKTQQGVELNWSTSSEQNTKDFQVQHSINAQQWTSVGNLPAAGNSNAVRNYRFVHEGPFKNSIQHYYRILQRDLDGKFSYSKVIRIEYPDAATDVMLYPNPASDVLHINITERQELRLVNMQGVVVWKGVLPAGRHEIPVSNFATGNYILQAGKGVYKVMVQ